MMYLYNQVCCVLRHIGGARHGVGIVTVCVLLSAACAAVDAGGAITDTPPEYVGPPTPYHAVTNRAFQGIPSIAVAPSGRLWATWYAGITPAEDSNNYVVLSTSGDNGKTWKEVLVVDPDRDGPRRTFDPELWITPEGKLWWTWSDVIYRGEWATTRLWMMELADPDAEDSPRKPPAKIGIGGVMMCKPLTLSTGEWVLPISRWFTDGSAKMVVSTDRGKTWTVRGGVNTPKESRLYDEHRFVERKDGSLWALIRTRYGIGESVSTDRGRTWSDSKPSKLQHPSARFFIDRLSSGNLLLVKHGPLHEKTGRSHLTAYLSKDDGVTWQGGLLLDDGRRMSYPDGQQDKDGLIRIIYDSERRDSRLILMASFREEDVLSGRADSESVRLRQVVSKGSGGKEKVEEK